MNQKIEKFKKKEFSPYYTLEISMVCKNCGTSKGRWRAASDSATSFDFILTTCEYCGCFRFAATLYAKFFDNRDESNSELAHSRFDYELRADAESDKRLREPKTIKKVEGERLVDEWPEPEGTIALDSKEKAVDGMTSLKKSDWRKGIEDDL